MLVSTNGRPYTPGEMARPILQQDTQDEMCDLERSVRGIRGAAMTTASGEQAGVRRHRSCRHMCMRNVFRAAVAVASFIGAAGFSAGGQRTPRASASVLSEHHLEALQSMTPQQQAELLLERAINRYRGANEEIAARAPGWLGHLTSTERLESLFRMAINSDDMSGTPFSVLGDDTSLNLPGSVQTADQVKPAEKLGGVGRATPYYDPTAFTEVTEARFGNTGYNILRGPGLFNWDFGLTREFAVTHGVRMQLRMDSYNFTNTPHLANPDNNVGDGEDFMIEDSFQTAGIGAQIAHPRRSLPHERQHAFFATGRDRWRRALPRPDDNLVGVRTDSITSFERLECFGASAAVL